MEEVLIDKVVRDSAKKAELELMCMRLAEYTEHKKECATGNPTEVEDCTCGLKSLIDAVDAL